MRVPGFVMRDFPKAEFDGLSKPCPESCIPHQFKLGLYAVLRFKIGLFDKFEKRTL